MSVRDRVSMLASRSALQPRQVGVFVLTAFVAVVGTGPSGSFVAQPTVSAHTGLESSSPADGDVITDIVDEIQLVFTEPVELVGAGIEVLLPNEEISDVEPTTEDDVTFLLEFDPPIGNGEVGVRFDVISADGHPVTGSFSFAIDDPTPEATDPDPMEPETTGPEASDPATDETTTTGAGPGTTSPSTAAPATTAPAATEPATTALVAAATTAPEGTELDVASELTTAAEPSDPTTEEEDDSSTAIVVIVAILAALAATVIGVIYARRRNGTPPVDPADPSASGPASAAVDPEP